jgi:hypothetical protein
MVAGHPRRFLRCCAFRRREILEAAIPRANEACASSIVNGDWACCSKNITSSPCHVHPRFMESVETVSNVRLSEGVMVSGGLFGRCRALTKSLVACAIVAGAVLGPVPLPAAAAITTTTACASTTAPTAISSTTSATNAIGAGNGTTTSAAAAANQGTGVLAFTGTNAARLIAFGLALVVAGYLIVGTMRRRRPKGTSSSGCVAIALLLYNLRPAHLAAKSVVAAACSAPPANLPESPLAILLPITAVLAIAAWALVRRRAAPNQAR